MIILCLFQSGIEFMDLYSHLVLVYDVGAAQDVVDDCVVFVSVGDRVHGSVQPPGAGV